MKKIAIHPGEIMSKNDGQIHKIGARQLAELYGVDLRDCIVWEQDRPESYLGRNPDDYYHLYPRYYGDYKEIAADLREKMIV